jgi:YD repeat-containing protein
MPRSATLTPVEISALADRPRKGWRAGSWVTLWHRDNADRLIAVTHPGGDTITMRFDADRIRAMRRADGGSTTPGRIGQIQANIPGGASIPVIQIRPP